MADFVRVAHPSEEYSNAASHACASISSLVETLNTNTVIFSALKSVLDNSDVVPTDDIDRRVAELFLFDFEQSGIHLPPSDRQRFVELSEQILSLGSVFMQGCHRPVYVKRSSLPKQLQDIFSRNGDNVMVTGLFNDNPGDHTCTGWAKKTGPVLALITRRWLVVESRVIRQKFQNAVKKSTTHLHSEAFEYSLPNLHKYLSPPIFCQI